MPKFLEKSYLLTYIKFQVLTSSWCKIEIYTAIKTDKHVSVSTENHIVQ